MAPAPGAPAVRPLDSLRTMVAEDPTVGCLAEAGRALGRPLHLVGGCVRDWLLGRTPLDWDVVLPGDPASLLDWLRRHLDAPTPVVLDATLAIARLHLRDGRVIDVARLAGDDLALDLARRDLTINALAVDVATGEAFDPLGGYGDLQAGRVRACSRENLDDDPLRLIRVFRFAATLGFEVEPQTTGWVAALAPRLAEPAGERLLTEWHKLLSGTQPGHHLAAMGQVGLLGPALGSTQADLPRGRTRLEALLACLGAARGEPWDRLQAWLAEPLAGERTRRTSLLLAALLGADDGPGLAEVAARLRWSRKEQAQLECCLTLAGPCEELLAAGRPAREWHRFSLRAGEALPAVVALAGCRRPEARRAATEALAWCWERQDHPVPRLVDGHDLMREVGLPPGPHLARLLSAIEEEAALGLLKDRATALRWAAEAWRDGV